VLSPSGEPAEGVLMMTANRIRRGGPARTGGDGVFSIGPLVAGDHWLRVFAVDRVGGFAAPIARVVHAPSDRIEVRLLAAGTLSGTIVAAGTGEGVPGLTQISRPSGFGPQVVRVMREHFEFNYTNLGPGTYNLVATTNDGRVGILRAVELREGQTRGDLEIAVSATGSVRVTYTGTQSNVLMRALSEGVVLRSRTLLTGEALTLRAPPGPLVIEMVDYNTSLPPDEHEVHARRVVEVVALQELEVTFE